MPITLVFMFIFGICIQIVVLRPMIGEPIMSVIMVTIALSMICVLTTAFSSGTTPFCPSNTVLGMRSAAAAEP